MTYENSSTALSPDEIWAQVKLALRDMESQAAYKMWIAEIKPIGIEENTLYLNVPGAIHQEIIEKRYLDYIKTAIKGIFDIDLDVSIVCADNKTTNPSSYNEIIKDSSSDNSISINPKYTFDSFIVGSSNRFAHAASFAVADSPAFAYNPLFLHGGTGLGKTHLMQAVGNYIRHNHPHLRVMYVTSEQFTNDLINSIKEKTNEEFRNKYRSIDVLMVDDIQFIGDKESTQEEFFHTFNALHSDNRQIILTSDRPPREIATLEERLRTRFDWGIIADIQPPDFETRVAILKKKAQDESISIPDNMCSYISENVKSNIRELEGVLNRLKVYTRLEERPIDVDAVNDAILYYKGANGKIITPEYIIDSVSKYMSIPKEDIISQRRIREYVDARHISMFFIREYTELSLPRIGSLFGGRDHTTVISALKRIEADIKGNNRTLINIISDIRKNIEDVI